MLLSRLLLMPIIAMAAAVPLAAQPAGGADSISKSAFLSGIDAEFTQMDVNKDKKVSTAELEQHRRAAMLKRHQERVRATFAQLDSDKNGSLSQQEFAQVAGQPPAINVQPFMARIDTNKDSSLTQAEYRTGATADFDRLDANRDGTLSSAEAAAVAQAAAPAPAAARAPEGR